VTVSEPAIEIGERPAEPDTAVILAGLLDGNRPFLGEPDHRPLSVMLRHDGELVGGLVGETGRRVFYIDMLWLAPAWRHGGHGALILRAAEGEAIRRGCRTVWLDTYDFQARPFYERHGYHVFGELDGLPGGHRRWFMKKALAPSADAP
jgi:GNAT superfamily N-acetyltransferase